MINETPYPLLGEVVHFVSHAFGLVGEDEPLSQRLNGFAHESDFNLETANTLIDEALLIPLRRVDAAALNQVENWLTQLLADYKRIVLTVPANVADRITILRILPYELFIPNTLVFLNKLPVSPNVSRWFEPIDTCPIEEVLSWWMESFGVSESELLDFIGQHYLIDESASRDLLVCWKTDATLLDIPSLLEFKMSGKSEIRHLVFWLILAKAWQYTLQSVAKRFGYEASWTFTEIVHAVYREHLAEFRPKPAAIRATLMKEIKDLDELVYLRNALKKHCLRPLRQIFIEAASFDEKRARATLTKIETHALYPNFLYLVEHGWGRYYALCGDYEEALTHYQKAFEHAVYRAGRLTRQILKELLVLAVFLDDSAIIKHYYRWGCVMGLFSGLGETPEVSEIKALQKAFTKLFFVN